MGHVNEADGNFTVDLQWILCNNRESKRGAGSKAALERLNYEIYK